MATAGINPFTPFFTNNFAPVFNFVSNQLVSIPTPAPSDLVTAVCNYYQNLFYPSPGTLPQDIQVQLQAASYTIINAYNNAIPPDVISIYMPIQSFFAEAFTGLHYTNEVLAKVELQAWIKDIADNNTKAGMTSDEQAATFIAAGVSNGFFNNLTTIINNPTGLWLKYFINSEDATVAENYANIRIWTSESALGSLLGYTLAQEKGFITPTSDIASVNIISSLIGGTLIGMGKFMFGWVPRLQPISLQRYTPLI